VENLFVAIPVWIGIPTSIIAGNVIKPAPPASVPTKEDRIPISVNKKNDVPKAIPQILAVIK
jgi:hypothetical protein